MTQDILKKYARLLEEFENTEFGQSEKEGLARFLSREDINQESIKILVTKTEAEEESQDYFKKAQDQLFRFGVYLSTFEKIGTIKAELKPGEIMARIKANRSYNPPNIKYLLQR